MMAVELLAKSSEDESPDAGTAHWGPFPTKGQSMGGWVPEESDVPELRLSALSAEQAAEDLLGRYHSLSAEVGFMRSSCHGSNIDHVRAEERALREKLWAAQQDYGDNYEAAQAAQQRQEELVGMLRHELELSSSEIAGLTQECSSLERELSWKEQVCAGQVAASKEQALTIDTPKQQVEAPNGLHVPCGAGEEARSEALHELAAAQHAAAWASETRDVAQDELSCLEATYQAEKENVDTELSEFRRKHLSGHERQVSTTAKKLAEANERRQDLVRRVSMWQTLGESSKVRMDTCLENVRKAEQQVKDSGAKSAALREEFDVMSARLASASEASDNTARTFSRAHQQRHIAFGVVVFALGFAVARISALLA